MKRGLCGFMVAVIVVLLFLWLGVIPRSERSGDPPDRSAGGETVLPEASGTLAAPMKGQGPADEARAASPDPDRASESPEADHLVLSGYTLDQKDRPIADSRVVLYESESQCEGRSSSYLGLNTWIRPRATGSLDDLTPAGLVRVAETTSDPDGYFEFRVHRSEGKYSLRCVGPARSSYYVGGPFSPEGSPLSLRLDPVYELSGFLRDAESETGVVGANVDLVEEDVATRREEWGHIGERSRARRSSDVDGLFRFDLLPAGRYRLEVLHPDFPGIHREFVDIPVEEDPLVVFVPPPRGELVISGRVFDATTGLGVGGVEIDDTIGRYRVVSAPSGEYRIRLEAARVEYGLTLTASAPGYGDAIRSFRRPVNSQEWNIGLPPARCLLCRVVVSGERPVGGAKVFVSATIYERPGYGSTSMDRGITDGEGRCEFAELPAVETVKVFAFHPEYGVAHAEHADLREDGEPALVTLELVKGPVTVLATVRDLAGNPVPDTPVLLLQPRHPLPDTVVRTSIVLRALANMGNVRMARTDARGRLTFPDAFPGDTLVQAIGRGQLTDGVDGREDSVRSEVIRFEAEPGGNNSCELALWSTYRLYGRVRTPDGEALQGVFVNLLGWNDEHDWVLESPFARSNEFGNVRFTGLSPVKKVAIGVRSGNLTGPDPQWKSWKKVSVRAEPRRDEQEYWVAQELSSKPTVAEDLLFFAEIEPPSDAGDSEVEIVLELPPR